MITKEEDLWKKKRAERKEKERREKTGIGGLTQGGQAERLQAEASYPSGVLERPVAEGHTFIWRRCQEGGWIPSITQSRG